MSDAGGLAALGADDHHVAGGNRRFLFDDAAGHALSAGLLMLFDDDFLDTKQMKALLKLEYPLSACYDEWLKNDCTYMDMLRDTVDDFSENLARNQEQAKKKKRSEPER